jgi:hypothetical protein
MYSRLRGCRGFNFTTRGKFIFPADSQVWFIFNEVPFRKGFVMAYWSDFFSRFYDWLTWFFVTPDIRWALFLSGILSFISIILLFRKVVRL